MSALSNENISSLYVLKVEENELGSVKERKLSVFDLPL